MEKVAKYVILLVEDEKAISNLLTAYLSTPLPDGSCVEIIVCGNLDCAIQKYNERKDSINLVITDNLYLGGNGGGGAELIRGIWEIDNKTPIIVITGYADKFREENPDLREITIVDKPFSRAAFLSVVKQKLGLVPNQEVNPIFPKLEL